MDLHIRGISVIIMRKQMSFSHDKLFDLFACDLKLFLLLSRHNEIGLRLGLGLGLGVRARGWAWGWG